MSSASDLRIEWRNTDRDRQHAATGASVVKGLGYLGAFALALMWFAR